MNFLIGTTDRIVFIAFVTIVLQRLQIILLYYVISARGQCDRKCVDALRFTKTVHQVMIRHLFRNEKFNFFRLPVRELLTCIHGDTAFICDALDFLHEQTGSLWISIEKFGLILSIEIVKKVFSLLFSTWLNEVKRVDLAFINDDAKGLPRLRRTQQVDPL